MSKNDLYPEFSLVETTAPENHAEIAEGYNSNPGNYKDHILTGFRKLSDTPLISTDFVSCKCVLCKSSAGIFALHALSVPHTVRNDELVQIQLNNGEETKIVILDNPFSYSRSHYPYGYLSPGEKQIQADELFYLNLNVDKSKIYEIPLFIPRLEENSGYPVFNVIVDINNISVWTGIIYPNAPFNHCIYSFNINDLFKHF